MVNTEATIEIQYDGIGLVDALENAVKFAAVIEETSAHDISIAVNAPEFHLEMSAQRKQSILPPKPGA